jgi:hypothetical protein
MVRVEPVWSSEKPDSADIPVCPLSGKNRAGRDDELPGKSKGGSSMNLSKLSLLFICFSLSALFMSGGMTLSTASAGAPAQGADKFIYADFETIKDNRPVSSRGGFVQLFSYQENAANPSRFKGAQKGEATAPDVVRLSKEDPNKAISFDYELRIPNRWAGVTLEVHGQPDKDGKPVADDVSGYKYLTLQLYVTGATSVTVEFISKGHGIKIDSGSPQMSFKITKGFNTYRVPLDSLTQPPYVETRVKPKEVLKKLTQVNISVACNECVPTSGTVVIDNLIFQN